MINQKRSTNKLINQKSSTNKLTNQKSGTNKLANQRNNIDTPEWIKNKRCTINPANNKNLGNKSFKYAITSSNTNGKHRTRLNNIQKFIKDFVFEGINYPPNKENYENFENNNPSIKLTIFKTIKDENKLLIHYNQTKKQ